MNFKGFLLSMLASCCHGRNADERQISWSAATGVAAKFRELRQVPPHPSSIGLGRAQPTRKMVDAVHKRFNIDLQLEVGASRHFRSRVTVVQRYTSAPLQAEPRQLLA